MAEEIHEVAVGAVILAPGFAPFDPSIYDTYSYASHPNVLTSLEFERLLHRGGPRPLQLQSPRRVAFIQCVGSRIE